MRPLQRLFPPDSLIWRFRDVHLFQILNTMSFQIAQGSPLVLFARELGASASVIGLIASFPALLGVLQLPASRHMQRVGYRTMMLSGWTARVITLLALVPLPLLATALPAVWIVTALAVTMFVFNVVRGVASGAWMPWITALVPRNVRGSYLTNDRILNNIAVLVALGGGGLILALTRGIVVSDAPHATIEFGAALGYSVIFAISFVTGLISLYLMKRIPNPSQAHAESVAARTIPWRDVWNDASFRAFTRFTVTWQFVGAASGTFTLVFSREQAGLADGALVMLSAGSAVMAMLGLRLLGGKADHRGSKVFMAGVMGWWTVYYLIWLAMDTHVIGNSAGLVAALLLANGLFGAVFESVTTRLLMNTAGDRAGSAQYFAMQQVQNNLAAGLSPIVWGIALDAAQASGVGTSRYTIFFAVQLACVGLLLLLWRHIREHRGN